MEIPHKKIIKAFSHLLFPPLCLHCRQEVLEEAFPLCTDCLSLLELIDPVERCPYCFASDYCPERRVCGLCVKRLPMLHGIAAAFDYIGPAATLIRKMKYTNQPYLAEGCGAYLAAQLLRLEWPLPDVIVPVPIATTHWLERGYNQSVLLAQSISRLIQKPVAEVLVRRSGDYSQAGLSRHQRTKLGGSKFQLKPGYSLQDKTVLLVDDVMTTGSTIRKCAEAMMREYPGSIYGLAVCRAL